METPRAKLGLGMELSLGISYGNTWLGFRGIMECSGLDGTFGTVSFRGQGHLGIPNGCFTDSLVVRSSWDFFAPWRSSFSMDLHPVDAQIPQQKTWKGREPSPPGGIPARKKRHFPNFQRQEFLSSSPRSPSQKNNPLFHFSSLSFALFRSRFPPQRLLPELCGAIKSTPAFGSAGVPGKRRALGAGDIGCIHNS